MEYADKNRIAGWVRVPPGQASAISLVISDAVVSTVLATVTRSDLGLGAYAFSLTPPPGFDPSSLVLGKSAVVAAHDIHKLEIWAPLAAALRVSSFASSALGRFVTLLDKGARREIAQHLKMEISNQEALANKRLDVACGQISEDEVAIAGQNGHFFLYRGSNNVVDFYVARSSSAVVSGWKAVVDERRRRCEFLRCRFVQLFIPEKSSVLAELVPYDIEGPSELWSEVMCAMGREEHVIDAFTSLSSSAALHATYRFGDSHLSTFGCSLLTREVLARVRSKGGVEPLSVRRVRLKGDLVSRFPIVAPDGTETLLVAQAASFDGRPCGEPTLVSEWEPASGHSGARRSWINADAPINARVLCFGNSFFERGRYSSVLSWWMCRMFAEFTFVWSADFDWELVDDYAPDIVIGQTVERFMRRVPVA